MRHIQRIRRREGVSGRKPESPLEIIQDCIEVLYTSYIKLYHNNNACVEGTNGPRKLARLSQYVVSSSTKIPPFCKHKKWLVQGIIIIIIVEIQ